MAGEVSSEVMMEILKDIQRQVRDLRQDHLVAEARARADRAHMAGSSYPEGALHEEIARHAARLERIERRLNLRDAD